MEVKIGSSKYYGRKRGNTIEAVARFENKTEAKLFEREFSKMIHRLNKTMDHKNGFRAIVLFNKNC